MHRVVYFSNASLELTFPAIEAMVAKAAERNRPLQISGALHYNGLNFLHVLEGPHQTLTPLYLQIRKDPRHSGVVKLVHIRISNRSYPDWGMRLFCGAPKWIGVPLETTSREGDLPTMIDAFFGLGHGAAFGQPR